VVIYPSPKFAFPRSYVPGFFVRHDFGVPVLTDNILTFTIDGPIPAPHRFTLYPNFVPWSSNKYTLDFTFTDGEYFYVPSGTWLPVAYIVGWDFLPGFVRSRITLNAFYGGTWSFVDLPSAPPDYWLPPFPPQPPIVYP